MLPRPPPLATRSLGASFRGLPRSSSGSRWLGGAGCCCWPCLLPPPSLPPSLARGNGVGWGGPLSSHPLPEPKSGVTLLHPQGQAWEEACVAGEAPGATARNRDPPPTRGGPQPSHSEPLPHRLSGHCSGKNRATQPGPAPVPVPPVMLSWHSLEGLCLPAAPPPSQAVQAGSRWRDILCLFSTRGYP